MGYEVNVIDDDYCRWFSIWNWHRCLAFALHGLGELTANELVSEFKVALDLQYWNQHNLTPEEEEKREAIKIKQVKSNKGKVKIIHVNMTYDGNDKLRITGGSAAVPISGAMKDKAAVVKHGEHIMTMIRMQQETNRLCLDKLANISVTRQEAHDFGTMDGEKISADTCSKLWLGGMIAMACVGNGNPDDKAAKVMQSFIRDVVNWSDAKFKRKRAQINFELTEYWDTKELGSLPAFIGIMAQAAHTQTGILIT